MIGNGIEQKKKKKSDSMIGGYLDADCVVKGLEILYFDSLVNIFIP